MTRPIFGCALFFGLLGCNGLEGTMVSTNPYKENEARESRVGVLTVTAKQMDADTFELAFASVDDDVFAPIADGEVGRNTPAAITMGDCKVQARRKDRTQAQIPGGQACDLDGQSLKVEGGWLSLTNDVLYVEVRGALEAPGQAPVPYSLHHPGGIGGEHPVGRE